MLNQCDLVIGGGFTDDHTQTANAGGSPHSQLRADHRRLLYSLGCGVCPTFPQSARSTRFGRDPIMAVISAERKAGQALYIHSGGLRAPLLLPEHPAPEN